MIYLPVPQQLDPPPLKACNLDPSGRIAIPCSWGDTTGIPVSAGWDSRWKGQLRCPLAWPKGLKGSGNKESLYLGIPVDPRSPFLSGKTRISFNFIVALVLSKLHGYGILFFRDLLASGVRMRSAHTLVQS